MIVRLTKEFRFEMAHSLVNYDGPCRNVHGHSYILNVTIKGTPILDESNPKLGMVMDFKDLKDIVKSEIVDVYDHAYVVNEKAANLDELKKVLDCEKIILSNYQPTCENMIVDFANKIKSKLPNHIKLHSLKLNETATSFAEWFQEDNM
jgi:6-pyruvoyltetrahydropterin/6-carboxytetrahydropterin synthase